MPDNPRGREWTHDEEALLGTDRDGVIAARLGRTRGAVVQRRLTLGIPPAGKGRPLKSG
jgi:hypothetical protein